MLSGSAAGAPPGEFAENGKAAVVAGDLPAGILAFRHGLAEHPGDRELMDLLDAARDMVPYPPVADASERLRPDPPSNWDRWVGAWELTAFGLGFSALFAVGLSARFTTRPRWAVPVAAAGLLGFVAAAAVMNTSREDSRSVAVVVPDKGVILRTGNAESYPPKAAHPLPRGAEVTVLCHRGGWVQVQLAGGVAGWVREGEVVQ